MPLSKHQIVKLRFQIGPSVAEQLMPFRDPDVHAAILKALFQALTAERAYFGPEGAFEATHGNAAISLQVGPFKSGRDPEDDLSNYALFVELEGHVELQERDQEG